MRQPREFTAIALWAISLCLMVFGTADSIRDGHTSPWLAWGIFVAIVACVPTGWALVRREVAEHESVTIDQIAATVHALHHAEGVTPLGR